MAGTDSTYIGMGMASGSNGTVGYNKGDAIRGNPNGDVVESTQEQLNLGIAEVNTAQSTNKGAYIGMQSKAPEIK